MEMQIYYEKLAENLKIMRVRKKLSQQRLAVLAGVSIETVGGIERCSANPTLETLIAIAVALNVDLNTLLPLK